MKNLINRMAAFIKKECVLFEEISYLVGLKLIKKAKNLAVFTKETTKEVFSKNFNKTKIITENASVEIAEEVGDTIKSMVSLKNVLKNLFSATAKEFKKGFVHGVKFFFKTSFALIKLGKEHYASFYNVVAPLICLLVLIGTVSILTGFNLGLAVSIDGKEIARVKNEAVYESAHKMVQERIVYQDGEDAVVFKPNFRLAVVSEKNLTEETELTDRLILSSSKQITEAYGFYVDGKFEGAVMDTTEVDEAIAAKLDSYKTGAQNEVVSFVQDVQFVEGYYLNNTVVSSDKIIETINSEIAGDVYYTIVEGDTPIIIASKNNISYSELQALNPSMTETIYPGSQLLVSAKVPYLNVSVTRTEVYDVSVGFDTITKSSDSYYTGYSYISVSGKNGVNKVTADVTYVDGVETARKVTNTQVVSEPVSRVIIRGTKPAPSYSGSASAGSGSYIWPVGGNGGYVSCGWGGYYGHLAMDIACNVGTPIYAVASGRVTTVRYLTYSLGRYVMIDHGNGVVTTYAHNSVIYVSSGQYVNQGDVIALSGNTGRSTGPHLHIAFLVNGSYRNPANYIGYR